MINGNLDAAIKFKTNQENLKLVQIDAINDSLLLLVNTAVPNLELFGGPSSYHRIINLHQYERLLELVSSEYIFII